MNRFYDTREWKQLRFRVLIHYQRRCMACFATNTVLHVDHIKPISKFPELRLDFNNLQILCETCNLGKSNVYFHDLRPNIQESQPVIEPSEAKYLKATKKVSHIWIGLATACGMYSLDNLNSKKVKFYKEVSGKVCKVCLYHNPQT
jgi:5-methylcytosine-specific restriction endonuclease McrA